MTFTQFKNHLYYLACLIGVLLAVPGLVSLVPAKYQPIVGAIAGAAAWIKADANYHSNPDGTPATYAYRPPQK